MIVTDEHMNIIGLVLTDPDTGDSCYVSSPITDNKDGSYSFTIRNPKTGAEWKHTILTEEVLQA